MKFWYYMQSEERVLENSKTDRFWDFQEEMTYSGLCLVKLENKKIFVLNLFNLILQIMAPCNPDIRS